MNFLTIVFIYMLIIDRVSQEYFTFANIELNLAQMIRLLGTKLFPWKFWTGSRRVSTSKKFKYISCQYALKHIFLWVSRFKEHIIMMSTTRCAYFVIKLASSMVVKVKKTYFMRWVRAFDFDLASTARFCHAYGANQSKQSSLSTLFFSPLHNVKSAKFATWNLSQDLWTLV